jgi:Ca2+-binding EF-hand superfamily protein
MQMKQMKLLAIAVAVASASAGVDAQTANPAPVAGKPRIQLDANKDGVIDRTEAAQAPRLAEKFDQLDTDKDGKLSADERRQLRGMGQRGGTGAMHGRMQAADTDGDGRISRAEAQAAQAGGSERFERMDFNKDGYLDHADAQARAGQRRAECFAKADADRNNQLSRAEFDKMDETCGQMRAGAGNRLPRNTPNPGPLPPAK